MRAIWVVVAALGLVGILITAVTSTGSCATGATGCTESSISTDPTRWALIVVLGLIVAVAIYRIIKQARPK